MCVSARGLKACKLADSSTVEGQLHPHININRAEGIAMGGGRSNTVFPRIQQITHTNFNSCLLHTSGATNKHTTQTSTSRSANQNGLAANFHSKHSAFA